MQSSCQTSRTLSLYLIYCDYARVIYLPVAPSSFLLLALEFSKLFLILIINSGTGYQNDGFQINICNSVKGNCDSTTSVCQLGDNDSAGSANNFTFSDYKGSFSSSSYSPPNSSCPLLIILFVCILFFRIREGSGCEFW